MILNILRIWAELLRRTPAQNRFYYGYNGGDYKVVNSMMSVQYKLNDNHTFSIKPYYAREDAEYSAGAGNNTTPLRNDNVRDFWQAWFLLGRISI